MVFALTAFSLFNNLCSVASAAAHGKTIFSTNCCGVTLPKVEKKHIDEVQSIRKCLQIYNISHLPTVPELPNLWS